MYQYTFKKIIITGSVCVLILAACDNHQPGKSPNALKTNKSAKQAISREDFDTFFNKFNEDSVFQKSRIIFPLKGKITGGEGESDTTKFLSSQEWRAFNLLDNKDRIIKKIKIDKHRMDVQYGIDDTGIDVYFHFENKDDKWWLIYTDDRSD